MARSVRRIPEESGATGESLRGGHRQAGSAKPGTVQKVGGGILVGAGLLGLALPVLPGWLLIFAGLALMGEYRLHRWLKGLYERRLANRAAAKENE